MKNLAQITENQDIITKEYLVAGYEPLLPATPLDPTTKFLDGNRTWVTIETNSSQIKLAQTIYEQTVLQQKQGTASLTDVLLADTALREAQQNYLSAVVDYLKVDLELKKLTNQLLLKN